VSVSVDPQQRVQATIDDLVGSGAEIGLQVAVLREGEIAVDAVAGLPIRAARSQ
jgi:hypothetical protein